MDTTQNASTVISLLIDIVKYSITLYLFHFTYLLTYLLIHLFTYNHRPHHGITEYRSTYRGAKLFI